MSMVCAEPLFAYHSLKNALYNLLPDVISFQSLWMGGEQRHLRQVSYRLGDLFDDDMSNGSMDVDLCILGQLGLIGLVSSGASNTWGLGLPTCSWSYKYPQPMSEFWLPWNSLINVQMTFAQKTRLPRLKSNRIWTGVGESLFGRRAFEMGSSRWLGVQTRTLGL